MREIRVKITMHSIHNGVIIITENWLNSTVPEAAIDLAGRSVYRADKTTDSGKNRGGGVCVYILV